MKIQSLFITALFLLPIMAQANDCTIAVKDNFSMISSSKLERIEKMLAKKGYVVSESGFTDYSIEFNYGYMTTTTNCFIYAASAEILNSARQSVAEGDAEASMFRLTVSKASIPSAMSFKAFKRAYKKLPVCNKEL